MQERKQQISEFLSRLRLILEGKKSFISPCRRGINFLGFKIFPGYRLLQKDNVKRFKKRIIKMQERYLRHELELPKISDSIRSWVAHASYGCTYNLRKTILARVIFTNGN